MAGDPYKDDLAAAHARLRSLEQENERLRQRLDGKAPAAGPRRRPALRALLYVGAALFALALLAFVGTVARIGGGRGAMIVAVALVLVALVVAGLVLPALSCVCGPNEALVVSGRRTAGPDGVVRGYRVVRGGRCVRLPIVERVDRVDLTALPIAVDVANVYARDGEPLTLRITATVVVGSDPRLLMRFIERFLGVSREHVARAAGETLTGCARQVIAAAAAEDARHDPTLVAQRVVEESDEPLATLGLSVDQLSIGAV